jgi:hypothetical protein
MTLLRLDHAILERSKPAPRAKPKLMKRDAVTTIRLRALQRGESRQKMAQMRGTMIFQLE